MTLASNRSFAGTWNQGSATVNLAGFTLDASRTDTFRQRGHDHRRGTPEGLAGGVDTIAGGVSPGARPACRLAACVAVSVNGNSTYAATPRGGWRDHAITVATGDTLTLTGSSTLAGSIAGAGALIFAGGTASANSGAGFSVAAITLGSPPATLNVGGEHYAPSASGAFARNRNHSPSPPATTSHFMAGPPWP